MVLITKSVVNATSALGTPDSINGLSADIFTSTPKGSQVGLLTGTVAAPVKSNQASKAIGAVAGGVANAAVSTAITTALSKIPSVTGTIQKAVGLNSVVSSNGILGAVQAKGASYLNTALGTISGSLGSNLKGLANGLNGQLSGIFNNTNKTTASTVTTQVSDPIKVNLLSASAPAASGFKITPLSSAPQAVTQAGASTDFGTNASSMIGTTAIGTLTDRYNLNSSIGVPASVAKSASKLSLGGLFGGTTSLGSVAGSLTKSAVGSVFEDNLAAGVLSSLAGSAVKSVTNTMAAGVVNDAKNFSAKASPLAQSLGLDPMDYFSAYSDISLLDDQGNVVNTNGSRVDAGTANSLLDVIKEIGCNPGVNYYNSAVYSDSMYNLTLQQAVSLGLDALIDELLGCNKATTSGGQIAISNALDIAVSSDAALSSKIIDKVDNPLVKNSDAFVAAAITNPNLLPSDVNTVNNMLVKIGSSTDQAFQIPSDVGLVYDSAVITQSQKGFVDTCFGDSTFSTYVGGSELVLDNTGTYTLV